jgi:hypothetical protein
MLTTAQIASALGTSYGRAIRLLSRPFTLPYILSPNTEKGGGRSRLYQIGAVLPRVKQAGATPEHIAKLFELGHYPWTPT